MMLVYRPIGYNPVLLSKLQQEAAEQDGLKIAEQFHNQVYKDEPFSLRINHKVLNTLLLHDKVSSFISKRFAGRFYNLRWPQVRLEDDRLNLMGQISYKGINAVLTICCKLEITEAGRLRITRMPIKLGAITVPASIIQEELEDTLRKLRKKTEYHNKSNNKELSNDFWDKLPHDLTGIIENGQLELDSTVVIDKETRVKITSIKIKDGAIELGFAPD